MYNVASKDRTLVKGWLRAWTGFIATGMTVIVFTLSFTRPTLSCTGVSQHSRSVAQESACIEYKYIHIFKVTTKALKNRAGLPQRLPYADLGALRSSLPFWTSLYQHVQPKLSLMGISHTKWPSAKSIDRLTSVDRIKRAAAALMYKLSGND